MPDPSQSRQSENEPSTGSPQTVFANLNRLDRPLLTEMGYRVFTGTTLFVWALLIFVVWVLRVEISLTRDLISSLAGSSVELAALSLAVLAILHELNKKDRWFKVGLLLVAILFAGVVFGGFFLALTWQDWFDKPQTITIVVAGVLVVIAAFQVDWRLLLKWVRMRRGSSVGVGLEARAIHRIRLGVPFILPVLLIWFPGMNRLTSVVIVFAGALLALVVLMVVTTVTLLQSQRGAEAEDPSLTALRNLKTTMVDGIRSLQAHRIKALPPYTPDDERATGPEMLDMNAIVERVRQMGVTQSRTRLENVVSSLVDEGIVCRDGYSYWLVPGEDVFSESANRLQGLALVISETSNSRTEFTFEGLRFTKLRNWVAVELHIPEFVAGEYVVPRLVRTLRDKKFYGLLTKENYSVFVNRISLTQSKWERLVNDARTNAEWTCSTRTGDARVKCINQFTWISILRALPNTNDASRFEPDPEDLRVLGSFYPHHVNHV